MKYGIERELTRGEAKQMYENGGIIAIVFDKRDPETRVYEFSAEIEGEPDFDKAVMIFEAKKSCCSSWRAASRMKKSRE